MTHLHSAHPVVKASECESPEHIDGTLVRKKRKRARAHEADGLGHDARLGRPCLVNVCARREKQSLLSGAPK